MSLVYAITNAYKPEMSKSETPKMRKYLQGIHDQELHLWPRKYKWCPAESHTKPQYPPLALPRGVVVEWSICRHPAESQQCYSVEQRRGPRERRPRRESRNHTESPFPSTLEKGLIDPPFLNCSPAPNETGTRVQLSFCLQCSCSELVATNC